MQPQHLNYGQSGHWLHAFNMNTNEWRFFNIYFEMHVNIFLNTIFLKKKADWYFIKTAFTYL